jgi:hypothetical protein
MSAEKKRAPERIVFIRRFYNSRSKQSDESGTARQAIDGDHCSAAAEIVTSLKRLRS